MGASKPTSPLAIPELLEQVFLHLTQGEILQVQRVSHFWLDTISDSPSLQQKLFFQPLPPSKAAKRLPEFNPIVEALFPFLFDPDNYPCDSPWLYKGTAAKTIQHWARDPDRRQAILRPEASWRLMLPLQPAAPIDGILKTEWNSTDDGAENVLEWFGVDPAKHASALASRSDLGTNATMGILYDIVLHYFSSGDWATSVCVQWNMFDTEFRKMFKLGKYEEGKTRNTITVHVTPRREGVWHVPTSWPGLRTVLGLPAGLVCESNKANRYPGGYSHGEYQLWGKLPAGLESELDRERCESSEW